MSYIDKGSPVKNFLFSLFCFLLVFEVHYRTERVVSTDSRWSTYVAHSIVNQGDTNIDEYFTPVGAVGWEFKYKGNWYNYFPIGSSLIAVPAAFLFQNHGGFQKFIANRTSPPPSRNVVDSKIRTNLEVFVASFCVALSAMLVFLIARHQGLHIIMALFLTACFSFGSSTWTISRGLWQHTPLILFVLLCLFMILKSKKTPQLLGYIGLPLSIAFVVRPTAAQFILPIMVYVYSRSPKQLVKLVLCASPAAVLWMYYNFSIYGSIFQPYYEPGRLSWFSSTYFEAILGNIFSPSRGFLVFHPLLILGFIGIFIKVRNQGLDTLDKCLLAWALFHTHSISSYGHWWAGHSTGPRLMTDLLPAAIYFMIPCLLACQKGLASPWTKKTLLLAKFVSAGF